MWRTIVQDYERLSCRSISCEDESISPPSAALKRRALAPVISELIELKLESFGLTLILSARKGIRGSRKVILELGVRG